jgi:hypothetical protein
MVYLYGGSIFIGMFFQFLVTINGGEPAQPQKLDFHPDNLPFAPSPDRAVPCHLDPSV